MKIFEREVRTTPSPQRESTVVVDGGPAATHWGISQILPDDHGFTNSQGLTVAGRFVKGCAPPTCCRSLLLENFDQRTPGQLG